MQPGCKNGQRRSHKRDTPAKTKSKGLSKKKGMFQESNPGGDSRSISTASFIKGTGTSDKCELTCEIKSITTGCKLNR